MPEAARGREAAQRYWDWRGGEYLPLGKAEMVLGGVGSIRLAPRFIRGGEVCFLGATSNGISHQGIPVIVPIDEGAGIIQRIKANGAWVGTLTGTFWPLPVEQSPIIFDRGMPKYYLFVERIWPSRNRASEPLVTVAVTFDSTYSCRSENWECVGAVKINPWKNWSFASFNPSGGPAELRKAVDWLKDYAIRHITVYEGDQSKEIPLSIVGDFDEAIQHFDNPLEFPLASILSGRYDSRILEFYGRKLKITINKELIMGDKFENIHNSVIVNRSVVRDPRGTLRAAASEHPAQGSMTPDDVLSRLLELLPSQFEEVLFRARVSTAHVPGDGAPQTARAIAAIRYLEQQGRIEQLVRILDDLAK